MRIPKYADIPIQECGEMMVDLAAFPFVLEPMPFRRGFTKSPLLWSRQTVALKLAETQKKHLEPKGLRFKIWDAWRSRGVQDKIYAACWTMLGEEHPDWDEDRLKEEAARYVISGNGEDGLVPPHTTGAALDLTIVHDDGSALPMGSGYCEWMARLPACPVKTGPDAEICDNLRRLLIIMQEAGFAQDKSQWWHFDYGNQKWALQAGAPVAIYGELVGGSMGFMKKEWANGHGMLLPYEMRNPA